jgi:hypothetical protein
MRGDRLAGAEPAPTLEGHISKAFDGELTAEKKRAPGGALVNYHQGLTYL